MPRDIVSPCHSGCPTVNDFLSSILNIMKKDDLYIYRFSTVTKGMILYLK